MIFLVNGGPTRRGKVASLEATTCPSPKVDSTCSVKIFFGRVGG